MVYIYIVRASERCIAIECKVEAISVLSCSREIASVFLRYLNNASGRSPGAISGLDVPGLTTPLPERHDVAGAEVWSRRFFFTLTHTFTKRMEIRRRDQPPDDRQAILTPRTFTNASIWSLLISSTELYFKFDSESSREQVLNLSHPLFSCIHAEIN